MIIESSILSTIEPPALHLDGWLDRHAPWVLASALAAPSVIEQIQKFAFVQELLEGTGCTTVVIQTATGATQLATAASYAATRSLCYVRNAMAKRFPTFFMRKRDYSIAMAVKKQLEEFVSSSDRSAFLAGYCSQAVVVLALSKSKYRTQAFKKNQQFSPEEIYDRGRIRLSHFNRESEAYQSAFGLRNDPIAAIEWTRSLGLVGRLEHGSEDRQILCASLDGKVPPSEMEDLKLIISKEYA